MSDYRIDRTSWAQHDIFYQMGNVAAEVGRSINACRNGKTDRMDRAIDRAVDLLDATIEDLAHQRSPRLKEVLRAREEYLRLFFDDRFDEDADNIERYFMQFAIASRNGAKA